MNKKIKLFSVGIIALFGLFAGAGFVSAQTATVATCSSATINGRITDTNGVQTSAWFEWSTSFSTVESGSGTKTASQVFTVPQDYSQTISGLNQSTTYYYRAVVSNIYGTARGSTLSFTTLSCATVISIPVVTTNSASSVSQNTATLNGYVTPNGASTSAWFEYGTTQSLGSYTSSANYGTTATSFSATLWNLSPNTTYYYRAAASNSQGPANSGIILSFTTSGQTQTQTQTTSTVGTSPTATTLLSTELADTTAKLNGLVFTSISQSSSAWFEWGTNSSLTNKTQTLNVGMLPVVKLSDTITGLVSGQTYYYRIVAENPYGKAYGDILSFVSGGTPIVQDTEVVINRAPAKTVAVKPTVTVVGRGSAEASLVALTIDGGEETIVPGEKRVYHIVWKNESAQSLKNVVLRATFPQTMTVESSTRGVFSGADNTVTVDLKTLDPSEGGDAFIFATAGRGAKAGDLLVVAANMVYTGANGIQGDAIAYVTHRVETATTSALGANIFGSGSFIPTTLLEWILLVVLVLILVLLGNYLYGKFSNE